MNQRARGPIFGGGAGEIRMPEFDFSKFSGRSFGIVILVAIVIWLLSGIYMVGPDESGVVRRFGKMVRVTSSGIHWRVPYPFEKVDTPKVTEVKRLEIGFRTIDPGPPARYRSIPTESLMLTGDENIVDIDIIVQFKIKDAAAFLFQVREPEETVRDGAEAALRQVIGKHSIDEVLTTGKFEIQNEIKEQLQVIMDNYGIGLLIVAVQLQDVHPPEEVIAAFKDVASAKEDKDKLRNQALGYNNDIIPKTRGRAEQAIREAEAYKQERIKRSEGDAKKFLTILREYQKARSVTEKRLYLETMEEILPGIRKFIVKTDGKGGLINILNLDKTPVLGTQKGGGSNE